MSSINRYLKAYSYSLLAFFFSQLKTVFLFMIPDGRKWLAVIPHPPILIWTISEEGALETWRTLSYGLFSYLWPESSMVPDGHKCRAPTAQTWYGHLASQGFACSFFILSGSGLAPETSHFSCCAPQLWLAGKKKSPFFFFF